MWREVGAAEDGGAKEFAAVCDALAGEWDDALLGGGEDRIEEAGWIRGGGGGAGAGHDGGGGGG